MKVISRPDISDWKINCTCGACDSVLEAERADIRSESFDGDQREPGYTAYYVICPTCATKVGLNANDIPKYVKLLINKPKPSNDYYDK